MPPDDEKPRFLMGRAGLVFAYVCFAIALATIGAAIYLLPLDLKVKIFLSAATLLLISMFSFMAVAAHLVSRPLAGAKPARPAEPDRGPEPQNSTKVARKHAD